MILIVGIYYIGQQPYIVIVDLDMLKQILVKDFDDFSDHAVSYYPGILPAMFKLSISEPAFNDNLYYCKHINSGPVIYIGHGHCKFHDPHVIKGGRVYFYNA